MHDPGLIGYLILAFTILVESRSIKRKLKTMDRDIKAALDEANDRIEILTEAVTTLSTDVVQEKNALDAALNAPTVDKAELIAAAKAMSAKLNGAISTAQTALAAVAPAAPPADVPPAS